MESVIIEVSVSSLIVSCIHCIDCINFRLMRSSLLGPEGVFEFRSVLSINVSIAIIDRVLGDNRLILFTAAVHSILFFTILYFVCIYL